MLGRFDLVAGLVRARALTTVKALAAVALLAGCSSVPDAVNPIEWYKSAEDLVTGTDRSQVATPVPPKGEYPDINKSPADTRKDLAKGLPADKGNAKYAEPVRRESTPTKALAKKAPAAADTQVAAAPAVPPKPVVVKQELDAPAPTQVAQAAPPQPRLSADRRTPQARDDGPSAPPASVDMTPPPPADVPERVAVAGKGRPRPLQEQFQKRLAESAQQVVSPGMVDMPRPALASASTYGAAEEEPIHLVPPGSAKHRTVKGGGKGLAAPAPEPAASFQVAALDFDGTSLTQADRVSIAEVARVYKQTRGVVRIVGHAPVSGFRGDAVTQMMDGFEASLARANAVARELTKRGVPAAKIMVGAEPAAGEAGAQVFLDVI